MTIFSKNSEPPTPALITKSPVKMNTRSVVVKVATILQDIAFSRLLTGFSTLITQSKVNICYEGCMSIIVFPKLMRQSLLKPFFFIKTLAVSGGNQKVYCS
jgi:hypothetical protein